MNTMEYTENFSRHWDAMTEQISSQIGHIPMEAATPGKINELYRASSYRFSSIIATEGLMLDQLHKPEFKSELISAIAKFKFSPVDIPKKPSFALRFIIGIAAAAAVGIPLIILKDISVWIVVLEAVACVLAAVVLYASSLDKYNKEAPRQLCDQYAAQLAGYKQTLIDICEKHCK